MKLQKIILSGSLAETEDYIDKTLTAEYEFQRNQLYSVQTPPILSPGLVIIVGLAAFLFSPSNTTVQVRHPQIMTVFLIFYGLSGFIALVCSLLLGRKRPRKIEKFAIEDVLASAYEVAVQKVCGAKPFENAPDLDTIVCARVRSEKLRRLREQIALCRRENVWRHNVSVWLLISIYLCILCGIFLALNFVGARIPEVASAPP